MSEEPTIAELQLKIVELETKLREKDHLIKGLINENDVMRQLIKSDENLLIKKNNDIIEKEKELQEKDKKFLEKVIIIHQGEMIKAQNEQIIHELEIRCCKFENEMSRLYHH